MSDRFFPGLFMGGCLGVVVVMVVMEARGVAPRQLAEKHCEAILDRKEFDKCKEAFLK
jgi:hypothetical protein